MQPDLVIIPDYTVEPIQGLRSAGLKVYVCHTPNNVQDIFKFIREIGSAVGEEAKGEAMAKNMEAQLEAVRKQRCRLQAISRLMCWHFPLPDRWA